MMVEARRPDGLRGLLDVDVSLEIESAGGNSGR